MSWPIQATGWYRFGGSPKARSIASASSSNTTSFAISGFAATGTRSSRSATESHAQPGADGEVGAGGAPRDLGGHVDDDPRKDEVLDTRVEAQDIPHVPLRRRGIEDLAVHCESVADLTAERSRGGLLDQVGSALDLANPGESQVHVEAQLPRQIEARERRAPEIDALGADRRAGRRQL